MWYGSLVKGMEKQIEHCSYLLIANSLWYRFINSMFLQLYVFWYFAYRDLFFVPDIFDVITSTCITS